MDDEIREALELTKEDLLDRAAAGEPARVARSDPRRRDSAASQSGGITVEPDVRSIVIQGGHLNERHFVTIEPSSVTISH